MPTFGAKFVPGQRVWNNRYKREVEVLSVEFVPAFGKGLIPLDPVPLYKIEYIGKLQGEMRWQRHVGEEYLEEGGLDERR